MEKQDVGKKLKELRLKKGVSQQIVADHIGTTKVAISQYESGSRLPRPAIMKKLADYYGESITYIFFS